ncbi:MAG: aminoacetone oxidase family FAD-binding enzyme, partial [Firmicutes bacterium]|nr:aminoacetone oxidase family FAD-binding enzyme [Bacillota bacterium]
MAEADVVVIGGGPAGLMACVGAARAGARVMLLEKGDRLGRKLLISGGGRCNVTNARGIEHILDNIPGNGRFLQSVLRQWSNEDIAHFFAQLGVALKEEDRGRLFPVTDRSDTVLQALVGHIGDLGVEICLQSPVQALVVTDDDGGQPAESGHGLSGYRSSIHAAATDGSPAKRVCGVVVGGGRRIAARAVVVATGGCSVPKTGSTGDGYRFAEAAGHRIVDVYPTSVPLMADDWWVRERVLQGVSLYGVRITLWSSRGKALCREEGDVVMTHFGLSGPAALRVSQYAVREQQKSGAGALRMTIALFPEETVEQVSGRLQALARLHPRRSLRNTLREVTVERVAQLVCGLANQDADAEVCNLSRAQWHSVASQLQGLAMNVTGTLGLERATVTGGGVNVREIDPSTMASRVTHGLYFAGEVMDVHAHTGGYNITV